ncbi:unnamed protein product [Sphagnum balticum]
MSWDLKNINNWERVLDNDQVTPYTPSNASDSSIGTGRRPNSAMSTTTSEGQGGGGEVAPLAPIPPSTSIKPKPNVVLGGAIDLKGDMDAYHWFLSTSWVPKLELPMEDFISR